LNGCPRDAEFQLELALREQSLTTTLDVVVHCLLWVIGLMEWCESVGRDAPEWLTSYDCPPHTP